jgi:hypothetical protein
VAGSAGQVSAGFAGAGGGSPSGAMQRPASGAAVVVIVGVGDGGGVLGGDVGDTAASFEGEGGAGSSTRWHVALPSTHRERSIGARIGPAF